MSRSELFLAEFSRLDISPTIETDARERRPNSNVNKSHEWLFLTINKEKERAGHKPGSVVDNHSSGTAVADCL